MDDANRRAARKSAADSHFFMPGRRPRREQDTGTPTPGKPLWTAANFSDPQTVEGAYAMQSVLVNFIYETERRRALQDEPDRAP